MEYEKLLSDAFRFVSFRLRSGKEIREYLVRRAKVDNETVQKVYDRMTDLGYVDDRKFTAWLIRSRQSNKPRGSRLISMELMRKGVGKDIFDELMQQDGDTELEAAHIAVEKKMPAWQKLPAPVRKKKIYDFLFRRGFGSDTARKIIDGTDGNGYNSQE